MSKRSMNDLVIGLQNEIKNLLAVNAELKEEKAKLQIFLEEANANAKAQAEMKMIARRQRDVITAKAKKALDCFSALTTKAQNYILPDSKITDKEFASEVIGLLDNPVQREAKASLVQFFKEEKQTLIMQTYFAASDSAWNMFVGTSSPEQLITFKCNQFIEACEEEDRI